MSGWSGCFWDACVETWKFPGTCQYKPPTNSVTSVIIRNVQAQSTQDASTQIRMQILSRLWCCLCVVWTTIHASRFHLLALRVRVQCGLGLSQRESRAVTWASHDHPLLSQAVQRTGIAKQCSGRVCQQGVRWREVTVLWQREWGQCGSTPLRCYSSAASSKFSAYGHVVHLITTWSPHVGSEVGGGLPRQSDQRKLLSCFSRVASQLSYPSYWCQFANLDIQFTSPCTNDRKSLFFWSDKQCSGNYSTISCKAAHFGVQSLPPPRDRLSNLGHILVGNPIYSGQKSY